MTHSLLQLAFLAMLVFWAGVTLLLMSRSGFWIAVLPLAIAAIVFCICVLIVLCLHRMAGPDWLSALSVVVINFVAFFGWLRLAKRN